MEGVDSWVRKWASLNSDGAAVTCRGETVTWGMLDRRVDVLARDLLARGVTRGDRVAALMRNSVEYLECLYATSRIGAIFVPLNIRYAAPELEFAVRHVDIRLVLTEEHFRPLVEESGIDVHVVWTSDWPAEDPRRTSRPLEAGSWTDPGFLLFTSGTTGRPRAVLHAQEALLWSSMDAVVIHGYSSTDRLVTPLPLCYTGGLNVATSVAHAGAHLIFGGVGRSAAVVRPNRGKPGHDLSRCPGDV